jgi:dienelactone hydrolase
MSTRSWAVVAIAAFAIHEYLAARRTPGQSRLHYVRAAFLMVLLGSVVMIGPSIQGRVERLWSSRHAPPAPFDRSGDPLRTQALADQQPEYPFPVSGSRDDIAAWRTRTLEALAERVGVGTKPGAPPTARPVPVTVIGSETVGTIQRTLIRFTSWDGTRIPAYVLDPGGTRKGAVLVVPGHGPGIVATAGITDGYEHQAALALARRGYLTLTPELRGFGMLSPQNEPTHRLVAAAALMAGTSYKAIEAKDLSLALTVLQQWPSVDPTRLAVTGTSLGGELAMLIGALDERVRVTVSNSYGGIIGPAVEDDDLTDESGQTPHGCHTIPGINRIVRQEDWVRLIAPRPARVVRGDHNTPDGIRDFERAVSQAFGSLGVLNRFDVVLEPGAHEFYIEPTAAFIDRWL